MGRRTGGLRACNWTPPAGSLAPDAMTSILRRKLDEAIVAAGWRRTSSQMSRAGEAVTGTEGATTLEYRWAAWPRRFADGDTVTVSLAANTEVTLVVADGDQYRVRRGSDFGWLQAEQVTQVPQLATPGLRSPRRRQPRLQPPPSPSMRERGRKTRSMESARAGAPVSAKRLGASGRAWRRSGPAMWTRNCSIELPRPRRAHPPSR